MRFYSLLRRCSTFSTSLSQQAPIADSSVSKELLLETRGSEIFNLKGQRLATVEGGEQLERGMLAAAFLLFC